MTPRSDRPPLDIEIDGTGSALYIRVAAAEVAKTRKIESGLLADYDARGRLVGLEVIGLGKRRVGAIFDNIRARFSDEAPALKHLDLLTA